MTHKNSMVSVIVPTYNGSKYIKQTIESALAQTYKRIEVIVVDDGSTDGTRDVLKTYMNRIVYVYKGNGGPASARNEGIKQAKGEFIAFLDGDDIWEKEKLEKQMVKLTNDDIGFVYSRVKKIDEKGYIVQSALNKKYLAGDIVEPLFYGNFIPTSSVVVKKECFESVGMFDEREDFISVEDYDMWLRIAALYKIGFVDEQLVLYRIHSAGISKNYERSYERERKVLEKFLELNNNKYPSLHRSWKKRVATLYYNLGIDLFVLDETSNARKSFYRSLQFNALQPKVVGYFLASCLGKGFINNVRNLKERKS